MTRVAAMTLTVLLFIFVVVVPALATVAAPATSTRARIRRRRRLHGVRELLQAEPDAALVRIDADHEERQLVADGDEVLRSIHRPVRHLRDVQEPIDTRLQLDERAEVGEAHDPAGHARADRE